MRHLHTIFLLIGEDTASRIFVEDVLFFLFRGDGDSLYKEAGFRFLGDALGDVESPRDEDESTALSSGSCFSTALVKWFPKNKKNVMSNTLFEERVCTKCIKNVNVIGHYPLGLLRTNETNNDK